MQRSYVNVFQIFALANTHDLSWGTKAVDNESTSQKDVLAKPLEFRTFRVIGWSIRNMVLVFVFTSAITVTATIFMKGPLFVTLGLNAFRFLGSCLSDCAITLLQAKVGKEPVCGETETNVVTTPTTG